jgi:glycosyltransferase involved in cell wall biosynthesis
VTAGPLASIIIVTHNSQDDIVIQSYDRMTEIEVIIVDNASTDKTVEKIEQNFFYLESV